MPGFGDTFVQSMQFGTQIAQRQDEKQQEERQFATQIALKERDMQAQQAMEALKMDALNRQIANQDAQHAETMKFNYEHDNKEMTQAELNTYTSRFVEVNPKEAAKYGIPYHKASDDANMFKRLPLGTQTNVYVTDTENGRQLQAYKAAEYMQRKQDMKTNEALERLKSFSSGSNVPEIVKEVPTNHDYIKPSTTGALGKGWGNYQWHNERFKGSPFNFLGTLIKDSQWLASRIEDVGGLLSQDFSGNSPGEMKKEYTTDKDAIVKLLNEKASDAQWAMVNTNVPGSDVIRSRYAKWGQALEENGMLDERKYPLNNDALFALQQIRGVQEDQNYDAQEKLIDTQIALASKSPQLKNMSPEEQETFLAPLYEKKQKILALKALNTTTQAQRVGIAKPQ